MKLLWALFFARAPSSDSARPQIIMGNTAGGKRQEFYPSGSVKFYKGIEYNEDGSVKTSLFQDIADGALLPGKDQGTGVDADPSSRQLLHCDELCACFVPLAAANDMHVLVVPRAPGSRFIKSVHELVVSDLDLIAHMKRVGASVLTQRLAERRGAHGERFHFMFHVPPRNSIDHLHLHCIAGSDRREFKGYLKYPERDTYWCTQLGTVVDNLLKGRKPVS